MIGWKSRTVDPAVASFRYRVLKPIEALSKRGHLVELYSEQHFASYDQVVFSKSYEESDLALARRLRAAGKKVYLDLCDNHFYNPFGHPAYVRARTKLLEMIEVSTAVICSTPALARAVLEAADLSEALVVGDIFEDIGSSISTAEEHRPRLLWFGMHGAPNARAGMTDIIDIERDLTRVNKEIPFELVVVSNNRTKFDKIIAPLPLNSRYVEWNAERLSVELAATFGVILPLSDNPFVACKTHNRLSLALAKGVPVVGDIIESYREFEPFCYLGNWPEGLAAVLHDNKAARYRAAPARAYLEAYWSMDAVALQWERALGLSTRKHGHDGIAPLIGGLRMSRSGYIIGWISDPRHNNSAINVQLLVNGEVRAVTSADLPSVEIDQARNSQCPARGFIFPGALVSASREPLLRCTLSLADTGEPVAYAMLDLHRAPL